MATLPTTDGSEIRRAERQNIDLPCSLFVNRRDCPARLADISGLGARIAAADLPDIGEEVLLVARGQQLVATIVWRTDTACGLAFHRTLRPAELDEIARAPRRRDKIWAAVAAG